LSALSDHSGLLTSYGRTIDAIFVGIVAFMQPVSASLTIGAFALTGGEHGPALSAGFGASVPASLCAIGRAPS